MDQRKRPGGREQHTRRPGRSPRLPAEERLSRFLAFVLRHHPEAIDLALDETGSADLDAVVTGLRAKPSFAETTRETVERLVADGPGVSRFEITGDRIRARYGHSLPQLVAYPPADPPEELFHGTSPDSAEMILASGLKAGDRQRVHLSVDTPSAQEVGLRRSPQPVILRVDTASASGAGIQFYRAAPLVWLSDNIPPEHISRGA